MARTWTPGTGSVSVGPVGQPVPARSVRVGVRASEDQACHPREQFWRGPVNLWVEYRDSHPPDGAREFVDFRCAK